MSASHFSKLQSCTTAWGIRPAAKNAGLHSAISSVQECTLSHSLQVLRGSSHTPCSQEEAKPKRFKLCTSALHQPWSLAMALQPSITSHLQVVYKPALSAASHCPVPCAQAEKRPAMSIACAAHGSTWWLVLHEACPLQCLQHCKSRA